MPEYSLNVALNGKHFCRIEFPNTLTEGEAKARATQVALAMQSQLATFGKAAVGMGTGASRRVRVECTLTWWETFDRDIEF